MRSSFLTALILSFAGCAMPIVEEPGPDHPANPSAAAAPAPAPSQTLALHAPGRMAAPAATQTAARYTCPMHPEVTSPNPEALCPRCKMKINKPIKPATAPAAAPASTHQGHQHGAH